jgi:hypothetical protein
LGARHIHHAGQGGGVRRALHSKRFSPGIGCVNRDTDQADQRRQHQGEYDHDLASLLESNLGAGILANWIRACPDSNQVDAGAE